MTTITDTHRVIAARALQKASLTDPMQRKADPMVIEAWAEHLAGNHLNHLDDALQAVYDHYDTPGARVMYPGDLVARMRALRADRALRETDAQRQARITAYDARIALTPTPQTSADTTDTAAAEHRKHLVTQFARSTGRIPDGAA